MSTCHTAPLLSHFAAMVTSFLSTFVPSVQVPPQLPHLVSVIALNRFDRVIPKDVGKSLSPKFMSESLGPSLKT